MVLSNHCCSWLNSVELEDRRRVFHFLLRVVRMVNTTSETSPERYVLPAVTINSNILVCKNTLLLLKYSNEEPASPALNSVGGGTFLSWLIHLNF